jgi:lipopolysaccharide export system permease protein
MFRLQKYFFFEILPAFILGLIFFVFLLMSFQFLRLAEFFLIHQIPALAIFEIMFSLILSLLPIILPMSTLFAILHTYSRANQDSELIILQSLGYAPWTVMLPALFLGGLSSAMAFYCFSTLAPKGTTLAETRLHELSQTKAIAALKPGTFADGFFDLVIYAGQVESSSNRLEQVFIYDDRDPQYPLTILAKRGRILPVRGEGFIGSLLELQDGTIHRPGPGQAGHTSVQFDQFAVQLFSAYSIHSRNRSLSALTNPELRQRKVELYRDSEGFWITEIELQKRWAISFAPLVFAFAALSLSMDNNRRKASRGFVMTLVFVLSYWILYLGGESFARTLARTEWFHPAISAWAPNTLFIIFGFLKMNWKI